MEKFEILKLFLGKGHQIDLESLNFFSKNEASLKKFLHEMESKEIPSTITMESVNFLLKTDIEITVHAVEKKTITVEELAKAFARRFGILKKILLSHLDLVNLLSISKITDKTKKISLIGIVNNINETSITISDDTGEANLVLDKKLVDGILVNDVLGFICEKNSGIHVRNIVFPDVPLRRNVKTLVEEKNIIFAEKITENVLKWVGEQKIPTNIIAFSKTGDDKEILQTSQAIFLQGTPATATAYNTFSIFLFDGSFLKSTMKDMKVDDFLISLFKKRYLNATVNFDANLINNAFVLENVPDIIVVKGLGEAIQTNYKGATLLTLDENTSWNINLKTREIIKIAAT
jgi:hypothetical protein